MVKIIKEKILSKYLYGASVQGIQEFIFATNELKTIVGASEIVKNINNKIKEKYEKNIIINAAGNVKLIFDENEKTILEDLVLNFSKKTKQLAFGITISQAVVKFESGKLKQAFEDLEKNLYIQRNKNEIPLDSSINILKLAPKTAKPMAESEKDTATLQKEKANISTGNIPKNRKNKTAIIHADGNGLGVMIASMSKSLSGDDEIIKAYKEFSTKLDKATNLAFDNAIEGIDVKSVRKIILGGDDMTIICEANSALDFTNKFLKEFESQTKAIFKNDGLTACAGIAYCNHKYPFHYAVNLAESLCNYAKKHSKDIVEKTDKLAPSSLMFHNIQSSNFTDFNEYIDKELTLNKGTDKVYLNYGPYFIKEQEQYSKIDDFNNLTNALMVSGSPSSRLREWLSILNQDSNQAKERLLRINQMMDLKQDMYNKQSLENNLFEFNKDMKLTELTFKRDNKTYTPIGDIDTHLSVVDWSNK